MRHYEKLSRSPRVFPWNKSADESRGGRHTRVHEEKVGKYAVAGYMLDRNVLGWNVACENSKRHRLNFSQWSVTPSVWGYQVGDEPVFSNKIRVLFKTLRACNTWHLWIWGSESFSFPPRRPKTQPLLTHRIKTSIKEIFNLSDLSHCPIATCFENTSKFIVIISRRATLFARSNKQSFAKRHVRKTISRF